MTSRAGEAKQTPAAEEAAAEAEEKDPELTQGAEEVAEETVSPTEDAAKAASDATAEPVGTQVGFLRLHTNDCAGPSDCYRPASPRPQLGRRNNHVITAMR